MELSLAEAPYEAQKNYGRLLAAAQDAPLAELDGIAAELQVRSVVDVGGAGGASGGGGGAAAAAVGSLAANGTLRGAGGAGGHRSE
jgi:hypothetical protein